MPLDASRLAVVDTVNGRRIFDRTALKPYPTPGDSAALLTISNGPSRTIRIDGTDDASISSLIRLLCERDTFPEGLADSLADDTITQDGLLDGSALPKPAIFRDSAATAQPNTGKMQMSTDKTSWAQWKGRVFLAAWTLYAGYYMCRKDMGMAKGGAISSLAVSLACFGGMYAVGQLVGGTLADRIGARRTALAGAGISILCTVSLAWCGRPNLALLLQLGNGFGQGFGWPALLKLFGGWFQAGERDRVLSWWSTSYILGGLLASSLTAWLLLNTDVASRTSFHPAYLVSSAVLLCSAFFFFKETHRLPAVPPQIETPSKFSEASVQDRPWRQLLSIEDPDHLQHVFPSEDDTLYPPLLAAQLSDLGSRLSSYFCGTHGFLLRAIRVPGPTCRGIRGSTLL